MCSIAGAKSGVSEMLDIMKHRAPDGNNVIAFPDYEIGMGRLAIVGRNSKEFPFQYNNLTLTFNGEIYNYQDLREELSNLGHIFRSDTDTEVLLHSYMEWGEDCLDKLNGMFAFAIFNTDTREILFARDIAGEKPFYYRHNKKGFAFASEAKALKWNCKELPPAHYGIYSLKTNELVIKRWWNFKPRLIDIETAEKELEVLLEDAVGIRTSAEVPFALYFSGGVDSTLLSTFEPYKKLFYDDTQYAAAEFKRVFPKIVWHLDYPIDSFSPFGLWQLAKQASKEGYKVIISGEGADELFGGYIRYVPNAVNYAARKRFPSYAKMFPYEGDLGWADFNGKMQGLLRMGDRMAAAHGIENRCPFLDRRIIEFAFSLPPELKTYGFDTKIILKRILKRRMPWYQDAEKHGLYCSVNKWLGVGDPLDKSKYLELQKTIWQKFQ